MMNCSNQTGKIKINSPIDLIAYGLVHKLKDNPLARWGAVLLLIFYLSVMAADFVAPTLPTPPNPVSLSYPPPKSFGARSREVTRVSGLAPTSIPPLKVLLI